MMDLTQKQWVKHSVFHPFEGFEDLRWKKGGSVLYASIVILLWFVAKILHDNLVGYQFAVTNTKMFSIVPYIVQTIAVFLVFVIGNWSICTLLDGEGTIKKIYIYSAYSMIPYVAGLYIRTLLSHVLIQDEVIFITCVTVISTAWSVLLMFNAIKAVDQQDHSGTAAHLCGNADYSDPAGAAGGTVPAGIRICFFRLHGDHIPRESIERTVEPI